MINKIISKRSFSNTTTRCSKTNKNVRNTMRAMILFNNTVSFRRERKFCEAISLAIKNYLFSFFSGYKFCGLALLLFLRVMFRRASPRSSCCTEQ